MASGMSALSRAIPHDEEGALVSIQGFSFFGCQRTALTVMLGRETHLNEV